MDSESRFSRPIPRLSRREVLQQAGTGFGYLALSGLLGQNVARGTGQGKPGPDQPGPLAPKAPHFPTKAKRIIFLFMQGAMSQMDTWEYKPTLQQNDGKVGPGGGSLVSSKFKFAQHGETGTWVSELYPNLSKHVDRFCFLRGLHTDTPAHPEAVIQIHTGATLVQLSRPSIGSWLLYGLGTENQNLPGYVTINPPPNFGGAVNFGCAFLPAHYQGTRVNDQGYLPNLKAQASNRLQRRQLDLVQEMNKDLSTSSSAPTELDGVISSYELAFRMQGEVPDLLDISREPKRILEEYGVTDGPTGSFARQCVMARRLSEAGVRFVEICHPGWDSITTCTRG